MLMMMTMVATLHGHFFPAYAHLQRARYPYAVVGKGKPAQLLREIGQRNPEVKKRAKGHIAADAGKAVKIKTFHLFTPVDKACHIAGAKAVVNIHHGNP